jgi:pimeloyl-ACP methyl ester carboxylesterase
LPFELAQGRRRCRSANDQNAGWAGIARRAFLGRRDNHRGRQRVVYVAAGAPDSGQSFNDWWKGYPAAPGAAEIKPYGEDRFVLTLKGFLHYFAQDLATDEAELLYCTQGPYVAAANNERITNAAWQDKPSWFIMGEQDYMLIIDLERDTAKRIGAQKTLVLQSSHVPMLSHPGEVADFIENAANEINELALMKGGR